MSSEPGPACAGSGCERPRISASRRYATLHSRKTIIKPAPDSALDFAPGAGGSKPAGSGHSAPAAFPRCRGGRHPGWAPPTRRTGRRRSGRSSRDGASWSSRLWCGFCHRLACLARVPGVSCLPGLIHDRRAPAVRGGDTRGLLFCHRFFRCRPPQYQQLAYVLHRGRVELGADLSQHRIALAADIAERAHLDQLMRAKVDVDLANDRRGQTVLADRDDGVQVMGAGAQLAPFGGSYGEHRRSVMDRGRGDDRLVRVWCRLDGSRKIQLRVVKEQRCSCASAPPAWRACRQAGSRNVRPRQTRMPHRGARRQALPPVPWS